MYNKISQSSAYLCLELFPEYNNKHINSNKYMLGFVANKHFFCKIQ